MAHPATNVQGTTYVRMQGTPQEEVVTKTATPLHRHRMSPSPKPEEIARVFNQHADDMHIATLGSRSVRSSTVVFESVSFTNGGSITLSHRMGTARFAVSIEDASDPSAGTATVGWTAKDESNVTLKAKGTFVADVVFRLKP